MKRIVIALLILSASLGIRAQQLDSLTRVRLSDKLEEYFDWAYDHRESLERNFEKWDILGIHVWPNTTALDNIKTWEGHVEYVRTFLKASMSFMVENYPPPK